MATILPFATGEAERSKRPAKIAGAVMGQVVIFPGVRVEYNDRPPSPAGKGRPRRRRRSPAKGAASA